MLEIHVELPFFAWLCEKTKLLTILQAICTCLPDKVLTFSYSLVPMKEKRYAMLAIARQACFAAAVYIKITRLDAGLHLVWFFSDATCLYAQGMHHHMAVSLSLPLSRTLQCTRLSVLLLPLSGTFFYHLCS